MSHDEGTAAAAAPLIKLPPFTTHSICAWFQRVETVFRLRAVTSSSRKADYILSELPEETFDQISPWLAAKGDNVITYEELKPEIIKLCTPTPEERAKRLINMLRMPIGEQRASAAFNEMWALATVPQPDGSAAPLDLLRVMWLARLPHEIRSQITDFTTTPLDALKAKADSIQGATSFTPPTRAAAITEPSPPPPTDSDMGRDNSVAAVDFRQRNQWQPTRPPNPRRQQHPPPRPPLRHQNSLCQYHQRYGPRAYSCRPPCAWPKNA